MKKYDSYKYSGIEWIGDLPSNWQIKRIKHTTYVKGRIGWQGMRSDEFLESSDSYVVTGTDFMKGLVKWDTCYQVPLERYEEDPFIQLREGDLLITKDGTIGKIAVVKDIPKIATLNSGVFLTRPLFDSYVPEFMYWILYSEVFKTFYDYNKSGSTIQHLYQNVFNEFMFPLPTIKEQTAIVNYLDHKTTQIDRLIAKKEQFIKLLEEERVAVINQAVTKGLDPTVSMKDSGIEWLGEIPEHWDVKKLKFIKSNIKNAFVDGPFGSNLKTEHFVENGDVYVIDSGLITSGVFHKKREMKTITNHHFETVLRSECKQNDIIIAKIGANFGMSGILPKLDKHSLVSGNTLKLTVNEKLYDLKLVHLQLLNLKTQGEIDLLVKGSAQPALSMGVMSDLPFVIPNSLDEQVKIRNYILNQHQRIDELISKSQEEIELLKEYKTALISEVVTGKVDVRDEVLN